MKKILLSLLILLALSCLLVACGEKECVHSFKSATCTTPKTCFYCGETEGDVLAHSWKEASCLTPKTCKLCKITEGEAFGHNWSSLICTDPKKCTRCGILGEKTEHAWESEVCLESPTCADCGYVGDVVAHDWSRASCEESSICQRCLATSGAPLGHNWEVTSCKEPKVCKNCSQTSTKDLPHEWLFRGCDEQRICKNCFKGEGAAYGHTWMEATCKSVKHCEKCDIQEGDLGEHKWKEATCSSPKICTTCQLVEGQPIGHLWKETLNVEPYCENGYTVYTCSTCQEETKTEHAPKYGNHILNRSNGECDRCGKQFDLSKLVLETVHLNKVHDLDCCGEFTTPETAVKIYKSITYADVGMPVIDLGGALPTSKGYENLVEFTYTSDGINFKCYAEIKVQGASSQWKEKKNFNIKLVDEAGNRNKIEIVDSWGKESKYCLKANYIDYSQSRNVVSGQIFGEIVKSRNDELKDTPNGGAIDGFPVLIYNNGVYQGLYTFNIPKDNWMFDMSHSDEKNQAIFMTNTWNYPVSFREISTNGFELEYASNEESLIDNDTQWAYDSMLDLIRFTLNSSDEEFVNRVHEYADVDKCIDSMIYTFFICADDNTSKNILWVTLDGKVWFSSMYDMDGTWGMRWNGNIEFDANTYPISSLVDGKGFPPEREGKQWVMNLLWERIYIHFFDRVCERYAELRDEGILSLDNISAHFIAFFDSIPEIVRETEKNKWKGVPSQNVDHLEQILTFAEERIKVFDETLNYHPT